MSGLNEPVDENVNAVAPDDSVPQIDFVVEDGTGQSGANSYVSLEAADRYFAVHNTAWMGLDDGEKKTILVKATEYIDSVFEWKGQKAERSQTLSFPRRNLVDNDGYTVEGVPGQLVAAVCDCAGELLGGADALFRTESDRGDVASESVGGAISVSYFQGTKKTGKTVYESVNSRLRGLYKDAGKKRVLSSRITR